MTIKRQAFIGSVEPTNLPGIQVGDIWIDTTANAVIKKCMSVAPVSWEAETIFKSYSISTQGLGAGVTVYAAGYYEAPLADANLSQASPTQTYGTANRSSAAHAFLVAGGAGSVDTGSCSIVVSGTSITDAGVRTTSDSETIVSDITAMTTNAYYETNKKWLGQITYTLTPAGGASTYSADFNYGFAKYEDFGNKDFTITQIEAVGYAGANDSNFDIQLIHHKDTGWTYSAAAFVSGNTPVESLVNDHSTDDEIDNGYHFAWKISNLSTDVNGSLLEGLLVRMVTTANNAIQYVNIHVGINYR